MDKRLEISTEIENEYNNGLPPNKHIKIIKENAFLLYKEGKISGHIYNLCAFSLETRPNEKKFINSVINALVRRDIAVFINKKHNYNFVLDTLGNWHQLYISYGMVFEERDPRIIQVFADGTFSFSVRICDNDKNKAEIFSYKKVEPLMIAEKVIEPLKIQN